MVSELRSYVEVEEDHVGENDNLPPHAGEVQNQQTVAGDPGNTDGHEVETHDSSSSFSRDVVMIDVGIVIRRWGLLEYWDVHMGHTCKDLIRGSRWVKQVSGPISSQVGGVDEWKQRGLSGGLALVWEDGLDVRILSFSKNHIDAVVRCQEEFRLTLFYKEHVVSNRVNRWNFLRRLSEVRGFPWIYRDGDAEVRARLDRAVVNSVWGMMFPRAMDFWDDTNRLSVRWSHKLRLCKEKLKSWNSSSFGNVQKRIKSLKGELEEIRKEDRNQTTIETEKYLCEELDRWLAREETLWIQRSKTFWMEQGDRNTKFFHAKAAHRKQKNWITKLKDSQGVLQEGEDMIMDIVTCYFSNIFQASIPREARHVDEELRNITPCIFEEMNDMLLRDISEEEIKKIVFSLGPMKAPVIDGFPAVFYQRVGISEKVNAENRDGIWWEEDGVTCRWKHSNNGVFTVKSPYEIIKAKNASRGVVRGEQSDYHKIHNFWKKVWSSKVPNKINVFWWRLYYNSFPDALNLRKRGVSLDRKCKLCGFREENALHVVRDCWRAKEVFNELEVDPALLSRGGAILVNWLWNCYKSCSEEELSIVMVTTWVCWKNWNRVSHDEESWRAKRAGIIARRVGGGVFHGCIQLLALCAQILGGRFSLHRGSPIKRRTGDALFDFAVI
ncbi:hypothetical protein QQ045_008266 [Rhodiola kirilowii]